MSNGKKVEQTGVINSTKVGAEVIKMLKKVNSTELLGWLARNEVIETEDFVMGYEVCIVDLDNNCIAYVLARMMEQLSPAILDDLYVVEGMYGTYLHTWIQLGETNIIIDPTLAQFENDVPHIAIVDLKLNEKYLWDEERMYPAESWLTTVSGIEIDAAPTEEDMIAMEGVTDDEVDADRVYKYDIGKGTYSFENPLDGLELFMYILEELDMELDTEEYVVENKLDPIDVQELKLKFNSAISHVQNLVDKRDYLEGMIDDL